jgi:hypothetical protein
MWRPVKTADQNMANKAALKLPDALIVRYFRAGELEQVRRVTTLRDKRVRVALRIGRADRTDTWLDLGGGIGYVPE